MTTASGCARKCRLHTKFGWHLPCHYCVTSHPTPRSAHGQPPAVRSGSAEDIRGLTGGPERGAPRPRRDAMPVAPTRPEDGEYVRIGGSSPATRSGPSPDPARRARRAGSPIQGDSVEPGTPLSGSAVALSGSRSTAGGGNE